MAETVEIDILANVDKAVGGLESFIKKIALAYVSVEGFKKIILESFKSFEESEMASQRLAAAIQITGQQSTASAQGLEAYAQSLQMVTTFSDEATVTSMGLLMQMGNLTEQGVRKAIPLLQDYAAVMGLDLTTAAEQFARMLASGTDSLGRFHLDIAKGLTSEERFVAILEQMEQKFGGFAKQVASTTTSGQIAIFKNQIDELKESLGGWLAEIFLPALQNLNKAFERIAQDKAAAEAIKAFAAGTADASQKVIGLQVALDDLAKEGARMQGLLEISPTNAEAKRQLAEIMHQMTLYQVELLKAQDALKKVQDQAGKGKGAFLNKEDTDALVSSLEDYSGFLNTSIIDRLVEFNKMSAAAMKPVVVVTEYVEDLTGALMEEAAALEEVNENAALYGSTFAGIGTAELEEMARVQKLTDIYTELGQQLASDVVSALGSFMEALGAAAAGEGDAGEAFQKFVVGLISQIGSLALAAGLRIIAETGNVPLGLAIMALGAVTAFAGGALGANPPATTYNPTANLPHYGGGGTVFGPTLAMLGENGPEDIVPHGGGRGVVINVYGGMWQADDLARQVVNAMRRW